MSSESDSDYPDGYLDAIQPSDDTGTETAVSNSIAKRAREHAQEVQRERRARVRELRRRAESALAGETDHDPDEILDELQEYLAEQPGLEEVLAPGSDAISDETKLSYRRFADMRRRSRRGEDVRIPVRQELSVYVEVAIGLGILHAATDATRFAPVRLEKLDVRGAESEIEGQPTPIGRVRVAADSTAHLEDREVVINHQDCEHVLVIANPREGKDSLIARACGNLMDEHGYKWVSLHDDGRFETSMIAAPNDEEPIKQSLERFDQEPKGYPERVYVPAVGLPDELPANHVPFSIGVDSLTPEIIGQLSGVNPRGSTERRIKHALQTVQEESGSVDELIRLLEKYADDTAAEITVTELRDQDEIEEESVKSETRTYEMGEDKLLRECAKSLMMLASEGLLRDAGEETNLDMIEVLEDRDHVAALNCNYLPDGDEHLQPLLETIWLRLMYKARDEHPWLPRVAVEIREIKELAPSTLDRAKYSKIVKALRQTLFFLSSQGGSRRIMLLGSTQYINDVYKPIRGNMPIKILLRMGDEKIRTLESAGFSFSEEEYLMLKRDFDTGWGMAITPGSGKVYPINWTGARCALSLGDLEWQARYALAMGFRYRERRDAWPESADSFDTDGERRSGPPDRGEWYLLEEDIREVAGDRPAQVDALPVEVLDHVLEERQEYPVPQDLRPQPVDVTDEQRDLSLISTEEAEARQTNEIYQKYGLDGVLRDWVSCKEETVLKMTRILEAIEDHAPSTYGEIEDLTGIPESTIKAYGREDARLGACMSKSNGVYQLTPVGKSAVETSWRAVFRDLD